MAESNTETSAVMRKPPEEQVPINVGLGSIVAVPIFRFGGERIAPMSDVYLFDDAGDMIFQRQLSLLELLTVAQGFAGAASALMQGAREGLTPVKGWAVAKSPIMQLIEELKESTGFAEEETAKFPFGSE